MKKLLVLCVATVFLLSLFSAGVVASAVEARQSIDSFFDQEYEVPYLMSEKEEASKDALGELFPLRVNLFRSSLISVFRNMYGDESLVPGLYKIVPGDPSDTAELLWAGDFSGMASYGLSVYLSADKTVYRYDLSSGTHDVVYQGEGEVLGTLACGDAWACFAEKKSSGEGSEVVFLHFPSSSEKRVYVGSCGVLGLYPVTNRIVELSVSNPLYAEAMEAAGVNRESDFVQTKEQFISWCNETFQGDFSDLISRSKGNFESLCMDLVQGFGLELEEQTSCFLDLKTGITYPRSQAESVPSQVFQTRWAEFMQAVTPNPPVESDGTGDSSSSDSEVISTDGAVTDLPPEQITQSAGTSSVPASEEGGTSLGSLWICVGIGGLLVCGGLLILLLKKKK